MIQLKTSIATIKLDINDLNLISSTNDAHLNLSPKLLNFFSNCS